MNVNCFKIIRTSKLTGYYVKFDDFAGFYTSQKQIDLNVDKTHLKPNTYLLNKVRWISIKDVLEFLNPEVYSNFYKNVKIYVFEGPSKDRLKYSNYENLDLISTYMGNKGGMGFEGKVYM